MVVFIVFTIDSFIPEARELDSRDRRVDFLVKFLSKCQHEHTLLTLVLDFYVDSADLFNKTDFKCWICQSK